MAGINSGSDSVRNRSRRFSRRRFVTLKKGFRFPRSLRVTGRVERPALSRVPTSAACYLPEGKPPAFAEIFRNPDLARSLHKLADGGRDAYYKGPIAETIVAYSKQQGGLFELKDSWITRVSG